MIKSVNKLATVLSTIIFDSNAWNALYDSYLTDEEVEKRKSDNGNTFLTTKTILIREWIEHLNKLKENDDRKGFCAEVERLFKKTSITRFPEFFVLYPTIEKVVSYKRSRMLTFKEFLVSYYELTTEEVFKQFVEEVRSELLSRIIYHRSTLNTHVNKRKFAGLPVSDVFSFDQYFNTTEVEELNKPIPVYYQKENKGNPYDLLNLSDEELENYKLGTSYGFTVDYQDYGEVIIAKFKPNDDYSATRELKEYRDEELDKGYYRVMKNQHLGRLIPVFEAVEDKPVLKMLVLKTNF